MGLNPDRPKNPAPAVQPLPGLDQALKLTFEKKTEVLKDPKLGLTNVDEIVSRITDDTLQKTDRNGVPVIDHILMVAHAANRGDYAQTMLERVYHPGLSTQDQHGTCGAESIVRLFNIKDIGEWARVSQELVTSGKSRLRFGTLVQMPDDFTKPDASSNRSNFDALLQSSFMNAAAPDGFKYSNSKQVYINKTDISEVRPEGMASDAAKALIESFSVRDGAGTPQLSPHRLVSKEIVTGAGLHEALLKEVNVKDKNGVAKKPTYIVLKWPHQDALHAVILLGRDDEGNVVFSNPHGATKDKNNGDTLSNPPRTIVENAVGRQSMTLDDFKRHFHSVLVEKYESTSAQETTFNKRVNEVAEIESQIGRKLENSVQGKTKEGVQRLLRENSFQQEMSRAVSEAISSPTTGGLSSFVGAERATTLAQEIKDARNIRDDAARASKVDEIVSAFMKGQQVQSLLSEYVQGTGKFVARQAVNDPNLQRTIESLTAGGAKGVKEFSNRRSLMAVESVAFDSIKEHTRSLITRHTTKSPLEVDTNQVGWFNTLSVSKVFDMLKQHDRKERTVSNYPQRLSNDDFSERDAFKRRVIYGIATFVGFAACASATATLGPGALVLGKGVLFFGGLATMSRSRGLGTDSAYSWEDFKRFTPGTHEEAMHGLASVFKSLRGDGLGISSRRENALKAIHSAMLKLEELHSRNPKGRLDPEQWQQEFRAIDETHKRLRPGVIQLVGSVAPVAAVSAPLWGPIGSLLGF